MSRLSTVALALVVAVGLAGCHGKKRPPAVATTAPPPAAPSSPSGPSGMDSEPIGGPDIRTLDDASPSSRDFEVTAADGERGPLDDIRFDYDSAALSDEARVVLEKHGLWLQNHRAAKLVIEGHCDERGTAEYNLALGDQRSQAVRNYLQTLGVASDRMRTVSLGKERPVAPGHDEASWARNRRAHFVVSR